MKPSDRSSVLSHLPSSLKRWISAFLALLMLVAPGTAAANWVCLYGSYYKERSTRVLSPLVKVHADLPWESELQVGYLLDQITSASAAAGNPGADAIFQEYRHEFDIAGGIQLLDLVKPVLRFRYSDEPDYKSIGFDSSLEFELFDKNTVLTANFGYLTDTISRREQTDAPPNPEPFAEHLKTYLVSAGVTQVLTPEFLVSIGAETQIARGFQENQYRVEQHPRRRNRYAVSSWGAYRIEATRTTIRLDYRFYADTWKLRAHTAELRVTQRIVPSLEIEPRIRVHFQNSVYFVDPVVVDGQTYRTEDPKLKKYEAQTFGLQLSWELSFLEGTFFDLFAGTLIQPYYAFVRQTSSYGNAHIAQLGALWPF